MQSTIETIYRSESRRIFATLVRLLGDFDLAEECLQEAFAAAMLQWPGEGVPENPRAWLISAARFKGIDRLRRQKRLEAIQRQLLHEVDEETEEPELDEIRDDRLRLIFTCCHPSLSAEVQIALTLREVCGLSTEMIAAAFLVPTATMAQRLVRGKAKIRTAGIPYSVPASHELPERLDAVLTVIYLVFNEGYSASSGNQLTRPDLSGEAIRLARLLLALLPEPEVQGLLALMLLHDARRDARLSHEGELLLLEEQDRERWHRPQIAEGQRLLESALASRSIGSYCLQAAIAAVHSEAESFGQTDWAQIVALYDLLLLAEPSPIVELNRAVAVAMRDGPAAGLALVDEILAAGQLNNYHLAHATRADLLRRLERAEEARSAYRRALDLACQEPERRFLQRRLQSLQ